MDLGFCQLIKRSSKRFRAGDVLLMYDEQKSFLTKPNRCHKHTRHTKTFQFMKTRQEMQNGSFNCHKTLLTKLNKP